MNRIGKIILILSILFISNFSYGSSLLYINSKFPLELNTTTDLYSRSQDPLLVVKREDGNYINNPALIASQNKVSFKYSFINNITFYNFNNYSLTSFNYKLYNDMINITLPVKYIGVLSFNFYLPYQNNVSIKDTILSQSIYLNGSLARLNFLLAKTYKNFSLGLETGKYIGSYNTDVFYISKDSSFWAARYTEENFFDKNYNRIDFLKIGVFYKFKTKLYLGGYYNKDFDQQIIKTIYRSSLSYYGTDISTFFSRDTSIIKFNNTYSFGIGYNISDDMFFTISGIYKGIISEGKYSRLGIGYSVGKKLEEKGNISLGFLYNNIKNYGLDINEYSAILGRSFPFGRNRSRVDLSIGALYRIDKNYNKEMKIFTSVGIVGFDKWGR